MRAIQAFLWGVFGATVPLLLRLFGRIQGGLSLPEFSWAQLLISIAYVLAAGLFACASKPENPKNAIWIGIAFPLLIHLLQGLY